MTNRLNIDIYFDFLYLAFYIFLLFHQWISVFTIDNIILSINRYYCINWLRNNINQISFCSLFAKVFLFFFNSCYIDRLRQFTYQFFFICSLYEHFILIHQQQVVFVFLCAEKLFTIRSVWFLSEFQTARKFFTARSSWFLPAISCHQLSFRKHTSFIAFFKSNIVKSKNLTKKSNKS